MTPREPASRAERSEPSRSGLATPAWRHVNAPVLAARHFPTLRPTNFRRRLSHRSEVQVRNSPTQRSPALGWRLCAACPQRHPGDVTTCSAPNGQRVTLGSASADEPPHWLYAWSLGGHRADLVSRRCPSFWYIFGPRCLTPQTIESLCSQPLEPASRDSAVES
jgi:hypothetical protein